MAWHGIARHTECAWFLEVVQGTFNLFEVVLGYLGIDQRGFNLLVPQELLDVADACTGLQQVRGVGMP